MPLNEESMVVKLEFLCQSKNDIKVVYDPIHSHAATHFEGTPQLKNLIVEALTAMVLEGSEVATHVDMGRVVGSCDVVNVDDTDEIVYAVRKNCEADSRVPFTKSRKGQACSMVALHAVRQDEETYLLSSAWIGTFGGDDEPFPGSPNATEGSIDFWSKHAFVWGSQPIVPDTETSICPWQA